MCTDPVACKGAGIDWTIGPIVDIIAPQPLETGCCYPTASMDSPLSSFLVYQGQVVSLVGQTQVCSRAFAAKPAGQASPWLGFHTGKNVSLPLRLTWRISQMELGDSGAGQPLKITIPYCVPPKHTGTIQHFSVSRHYHLPTAPHTLSQNWYKL